ncbi:SPO22-domain-containing protein [Macrolepiota fuliginosa MF-IS2]|uniref:SPO22-domain-containing protein n=1 Tax=Macrolepiota fuliginosa MF-IS2 TaxID=1400762 RepID=A0A9P5X6M9_9AGAR|nr:SPO22-domain-containing protein [Macrolepiota fuliginosa MF-IS2]
MPLITSTRPDLLARTKPHLNDSNIPNRPSLVQNLHQIASLAESFSEQRPRSNNSWNHLADNLDQEGVDLWNISGLVRLFPTDSLVLVAALRLAAFRLIEAGLELKPSIETLVHILRIASKTGNTLSEVGKNNMAATVLTAAAKYEELLRGSDDLDKIHQQSIACATIVYFSSRMEAAWKEGNHTVAEYTSQMIMSEFFISDSSTASHVRYAGDDQRLALLPPHDQKLLIHKLYQIGRSLLKNKEERNGVKTSNAVDWLRNAFRIVDHLEEATTPDVQELRISLLRTLARAYFLDGAYDQAEATLDELIPSIDSPKDQGSSEYQDLRWLRLAILKRRAAGDVALLDAFKSIINHMEMSEADITDILQELRTLTPFPLVTAVNQLCLQRALHCHEAGSDSIDRLLLSLIFHCAKDDDHARAMKTLDVTFTSVLEAEVELRSIPTTACLTLIWQYGDRHYQAKKWSEAADWFLAGTHQLFGGTSSTIFSKCLRKAALCYIEQKEYSKASTVIRRCPANEAATNYVIFLVAIHQGLDDEAIMSIRSMQKAPDFDRKMLLLATQVSHKLEMKPVLLSALEALLQTLKAGANSEAVVEAMTLIRCIIKMALKLLLDPVANKPVLMDTVVSHFRTAKILTETAVTQKSFVLITKDVSWLWRTAYNCAVQGCSEWSGCEERIAELFDISQELLEACCNASPADMDYEAALYIINSSFAAVSARVFSVRETMAATGSVGRERLLSIAAEISKSKNRIDGIINRNKVTEDGDAAHVRYLVHTLRVFETDFLVQLKDWGRVSAVIGEIVESGPLATDTYEAIADILWSDKECPVNVLYTCLEKILHGGLTHKSISVEKFARWLRGLCTISLARNTSDDRLKAIGHIEQALAVLEQHHENDESYPMDERQWLLATAYNTGTECLHASLFDEAKRWFEAATVICRFVPGGRERAEKVWKIIYCKTLT